MYPDDRSEWFELDDKVERWDGWRGEVSIHLKDVYVEQLRATLSCVEVRIEFDVECGELKYWGVTLLRVGVASMTGRGLILGTIRAACVALIDDVDVAFAARVRYGRQVEVREDRR